MSICRGIRGATTVPANTALDILQAATELLEKIVTANNVDKDDVAAIIFTATPDLDAVYPAVAARQLGWTMTPLVCTQEMVVPGSLSSCLRILVMWNTNLAPQEIHHIYLRGARVLRPDLAEEKEP